MSRPRISRICSSSRSSSERPSNMMRPFGILAVRRGSSRMIESAVTDLPEPDSPTMATTSPRFTVKLTPSTARTMPRVVVNWVWRSSTANSGAAASGCVFDRPRKFSPASTILKACPSVQALGGRTRRLLSSPVHNAGRRRNAQAGRDLHKCCAAECSLCTPTCAGGIQILAARDGNYAMAQCRRGGYA
jgi:hypothetical protein